MGLNKILIPHLSSSYYAKMQNIKTEFAEPCQIGQDFFLKKHKEVDKRYCQHSPF